MLNLRTSDKLVVDVCLNFNIRLDIEEQSSHLESIVNILVGVNWQVSTEVWSQTTVTLDKNNCKIFGRGNFALWKFFFQKVEVFYLIKLLSTLNKALNVPVHSLFRKCLPIQQMSDKESQEPLFEWRNLFP